MNKSMINLQLAICSTAKNVWKYEIDGKRYVVCENDKHKTAVGPDYNYIFDKTNGNFIRCGKNLQDDAAYSPIGPEIYDCECTTICHGVPDVNGIRSPCRFCYKANTSKGDNLSFENFKKIIDKMPRTLTQVAFGADSTCTNNPEIWDMMKYCRSIGVIPNITVADINDETADLLAKYCGAVAVSRYANGDICYNSVQKLTSRGMKQINIHFMISEQTYDLAIQTLEDIQKDARLKDMNAIVLLGLKKKGRAKTAFDVLSYDKFEHLIKYCLEHDIRHGFDSCSAPKFEKVIKNSDIEDASKKTLLECSESCESGLFSFYTSVDGCFHPCSFTEGEDLWGKGLSVLECDDFLKDIWHHEKTVEWRKKLIDSSIENTRFCPTFPEINEF